MSYLVVNDGRLVVRDGLLRVSSTNPPECCCGPDPCTNCEAGTPRYITVGIYDLNDKQPWHPGCLTKANAEGEYEIERNTSSNLCFWTGQFILPGCDVGTFAIINISVSVIANMVASVKVGTRALVSIRLTTNSGPAGGRLYSFELSKPYVPPYEVDMDCFDFDSYAFEALTASPTFGASPPNEAHFSVASGPSYITLAGHN